MIDSHGANSSTMPGRSTTIDWVDELKANDPRVQIWLDGISLYADLAVPAGAKSIVIFAHGTGSSRFSPRNRAIAEDLQKAGIATLLLDLLTQHEERVEAISGRHRFDIELLSSRLAVATAWVAECEELRSLAIGYFGASTGAAAALRAAAIFPTSVRAIVSRGGRPDLAGPAIKFVKAPTLLIVGGFDTTVIALNESAFAGLKCIKKLEIVPGASHLFEEAGAMERVSNLAVSWFDKYLAPRGRHVP